MLIHLEHPIVPKSSDLSVLNYLWRAINITEQETHEVSCQLLIAR